jgi:hypothetical protein
MVLDADFGRRRESIFLDDLRYAREIELAHGPQPATD